MNVNCTSRAIVSVEVRYALRRTGFRAPSRSDTNPASVGPTTLPISIRV